MSLDLLDQAKKYQKQKKWQLAIDNYKEYTDKNQSKASTYINYAKCFRSLGRTNEAKKILTEGIEIHPTSEQILQEQNNLYDSLSEWNLAVDTSNALLQLNPREADYYFRLGRAYAFSSKIKKAEEAYVSGLKQKHKMDTETLINKVREGFPDNSAYLSSEYIYIDGRNNFGAFIHHYKDRKYFTKITRYNRDDKREEAFYKDIRTKFPSLKSIVPAYIDSLIIDNLLYLTIEMIEGTRPVIKDMKDIVAASQKISSIRYEDIIKDHPNPNYSFQLNRPITIIRIFTKIHKESQNKKMFSRLYKFIEQNNYPDSIHEVVSRVEKEIMGNHLYELIIPEKHYSLLHGDLILSNIKIEETKETLQIFDWALFAIGPHFIDIARYFSSIITPYTTIKEIYLTNKETGGKLSIIEQIFFLYVLILLYITYLGKKDLEKYLDDCILPAVDDLEVLVTQLKQEEFGSVVESLADSKNEINKKYKELNKNHLKIKKQNKDLQIKFQNILDSKSWRVTAPMRKFMEKINKDK